MFAEEDLIPISALQHWVFCHRQWGLIHLEQIWEENKLTAEGKELHRQVDIPQFQTRHHVKRLTSLRLRSLKYGLTGIADVVEIHCKSESKEVEYYPVEYKRGKPKQDLCDQVQLCAQALCLEEMLKISIQKGAFFYGEIQRRHEIEFSDSLRNHTLDIIQQIHSANQAKKTPLATFENKCTSCSLLEKCMPQCTNKPKRASQYIKRVLSQMDEDY